MTWHIERLDPASPAALRLFQLSDEYMAGLYPAEANYMASAEDLQGPDAALYGCLAGDTLAACGAVKLLEADARYGEIKRLFVDLPYRGRGLSKLLMARLERHLVERGVALVRLEAGIEQPEALALYSRLGYVERGPFGVYTSNPYSVFFEKPLDLPDTTR